MENILRKGEIVCNKQFLLFSQCFLPYMIYIFNFKCTLKYCLQFASIWTSLRYLSSGNRLNEYKVYWQFYYYSHDFSDITYVMQLYHQQIVIVIECQENFEIFLCPHIERSGAYCFTVVCLSIPPSCQSVCLHKLNMKTKHFPITSKLI